ncbi:MAG: hypothetical protein WCQ47_02010 [bacterium]
MRKLLLIFVLVFSSTLFAEDTFFNFSIGPDIMVKKAPSGYDSTRFRMEAELGERYFGFVIQPSFGNDAFALFFGPRLMLPFQVGSRPIFIIPDLTVGADFGFAQETVGLAFDFKLGFRTFYEFAPGMAISFRPFGVCLRPVNVWFGNAPNQVQIAVTYEMNVGFTYFF